jgi:hypothetical protein
MLYRKYIFVLVTVFISACSDETQKVDEHVWKGKTEMIDKAKQLESIINDAALKQQERIKEIENK